MEQERRRITKSNCTLKKSDRNPEKNEKMRRTRVVTSDNENNARSMKKTLGITVKGIINK